MQPARKAAEESVNHLIPRLPLTTPFVDEPVLFQIQRYLDRHEFFRPWRGNPRLFTLLRMLQCEERVLKRFLSADVSDICLPLDEIAFSGLGVELDWDSFRLTQHYILSNPKYLSRSELDSTGLRVHRHLDNGEDYFESRGPLGEGATASVFKVQHTSWDNVQDGKFYACKRSTRGTWRQQKERIRLFVQELQILRRLSHPHTVRLVASYTDMKYFALVLHPMADESLKDMLSNVLIPLQAADSARLCRWFGCLASALTYLHEQCIRHKDIKPSNILLSSGTVYLCDFGISNDWTGSNPTTEGPSYLTRGYCSPEVWRKLPRNDASDVWSMGRVFCDMYTVLANRPLDDLMTCLGGNLLGVYDEGCLERLHNWLSSLILQDVPNGLLATIQHMMSEDQNVRPKASEVLRRFQTRKFGLERRYIGSCCQSAPDTSRSPATLDRFVAGLGLSMGSDDDVVHPRMDLTSRRPSLPASSMSGTNSAPAAILVEHRISLPSVGQEVTHHGDEHLIIEDPASISNLSRGSTTSGRPTSFGELSSRSQHLVKWSSGSVTSPKPTPVSSRLACNCVPRENAFRIQERLVLRISNISLSIKAKVPTIETSDHCGLGQNMLHLYESYSRPNLEKHRIWLKTRRLVVSHRIESSGKQVCSSFWIPLTDIYFISEDSSLTLRWPDCNKWDVRLIGNNKQSCDCIYDSDNPNNEITLLFTNPEEAIASRESFRAIYNDADGVTQWQSVEIIGQQTLDTAVVQNRDADTYRLACLLTQSSLSTSRFQVFIHWPHIDLDIRIISEYEGAQSAMAVRFDQISTPHYVSDIVNEPWIDESRTARYKASELVFGAYSMRFPFGASSSSSLPEGVKQTLQYLTDWTICFFAPNVKLTKMNMFSRTNYGVSDVILWERSFQEDTSIRHEARITFRHRKSEPNYLWRSGAVTASKKATFVSQNAEIVVLWKSHGSQLHTPTMTAVDEKGFPSYHAGDDSFTKLDLAFPDTCIIKEFISKYLELQQATVLDLPRRSPLKWSTVDTWKRDSGTSHATR